MKHSDKKKATILYVEDDEDLSFVTLDHLLLCGYDVTHEMTGDGAWKTFLSRRFDLCLLDVMLPHLDGFGLAQRIRKTNPNVPILFLTAKSLEEDRLNGFRIGGDDYITKPYSIEELVMKIDVFLRRRSVEQPTDVQPDIQIGQYLFRPANLQLISPDGVERQLTQKESDVLLYFCRHQNQLINRNQILIDLWGKDDYFLGRSLDVFISKLRKYLSVDENVSIETVHGVGFRFTTDTPESIE